MLARITAFAHYLLTISCIRSTSNFSCLVILISPNMLVLISIKKQVLPNRPEGPQEEEEEEEVVEGVIFEHIH